MFYFFSTTIFICREIIGIFLVNALQLFWQHDSTLTNTLYDVSMRRSLDHSKKGGILEP